VGEDRINMRLMSTLSPCVVDESRESQISLSPLPKYMMCERSTTGNPSSRLTIKTM
jgi:hypothetical protein